MPRLQKAARALGGGKVRHAIKGGLSAAGAVRTPFGERRGKPPRVGANVASGGPMTRSPSDLGRYLASVESASSLLVVGSEGGVEVVRTGPFSGAPGGGGGAANVVPPTPPHPSHYRRDRSASVAVAEGGPYRTAAEVREGRSRAGGAGRDGGGGGGGGGRDDWETRSLPSKPPPPGQPQVSFAPVPALALGLVPSDEDGDADDDDDDDAAAGGGGGGGDDPAGAAIDGEGTAGPEGGGTFLPGLGRADSMDSASERQKRALAAAAARGAMAAEGEVLVDFPAEDYVGPEGGDEGRGGGGGGGAPPRRTLRRGQVPPPPSAGRSVASASNASLRGGLARFSSIKSLDGFGPTSLRVRRRAAKGASKKERKSYVKGKVIDGKHELYTLSIAMMLGLRTSISRTNKSLTEELVGPEDAAAYEKAQDKYRHKLQWLDSDDFMAVEKYVFRPGGTEKSPAHKLGHTFKFKDYSPLAFAYIRRMFGVNEYEFLSSVCGSANFIEFISNAKSGQFFFYSNDGKYMIKTMTNDESKFLRRILPHYFRHCCQNPNTLLTKFLGMYRVKLYHLRRNVKFVIMNSVFDTDKILHSFYDLKGSVTGRMAKPGESVKKDNDVRMGLPDVAFALPPDVRTRLRSQVVADCAFLRDMKIMDYSMLVGVHYIPSAVPGSMASKSKATGQQSASAAAEGESSMASSSNRSTVGGGSRSEQAPPPPPPGSSRGSVVGHLAADEDSVVPTSIVAGPPASTAGGSRYSASERGDGPVSDRSDAESYSTMDPFYEDHDESSYLEGTSPRHRRGRSDTSDLGGIYSMASAVPDEVERKREEVAEQLYWPFHRLYNLHGRRRMVPISPEHLCPPPTEEEGGGGVDEEISMAPTDIAGNLSSSRPEPAASSRGLPSSLPGFVAPVSNRKDQGLEMDVSGLTGALPMRRVDAKLGKIQYYDGKIFYMGIIDVLQQFSIRKRAEARYRRLRGSGWQDASCVHPNLYADRFVGFFDEYSQRLARIEEEGDDDDDDDEGIEEMDFQDRKDRPAEPSLFPEDGGE